MISASLTGEWNVAAKDFNTLGKNFEKAAMRAVSKEATNWGVEIRKGIRTQKSAREARPPWPPLAASTIDAKGGKSKMLIDTGTLLRSIIAEKVAAGKWLVGVKRGAKSRDGEELVNIAAVHEFGTSVTSGRSGGSIIVTPQRQFIMPVYRRLSKKLEKSLWARFIKELAGTGMKKFGPAVKGTMHKIG